MKWDESLANLDPAYLTARFEVSPGWVLGHPQWPSTQARNRWLKATQALEVDESELDDATRERIATHDLM